MKKRLIKRWLLYHLCCHFIAFSAWSQGLNNEQYNYDFADLEYLFSSQHITPYKFNFKSNDKTSLNIIVRYFVKGALVKEHNLLNEVGKLMFKISDDPRTHYFPRQNSEKAPFYKFYIHTPEDKDAYIVSNTGGLISHIVLKNSNVKLIKSQALYDEKAPIKSRTPIIVIYGWDKNFISCPNFDDDVEAIKNDYDIVTIIYVEPFEVDDVVVDKK